MIPGQDNIWTFTAEKAGSYDGACSEFCGTQHGWMRLTVIAQPPEEFARWIAAQKQTPTAPAANTEALKLYAANACGGCHTIQGVSDGKVAPDLTHVGSRTTSAAGCSPTRPRTWLAGWPTHKPIKPGSADAELPHCARGAGALRWPPSWRS